ncbi:MAG: hypothetical protein IJR00_06855 [Lachnospiraceae bacterium]|nr:hypothetical protein [Lachnospiraceae bacterium]
MIHIYLCDPDAVYLARLHGYLKEHLQLAVRISEYTDPRYLADVKADGGKTLLVADEDFAEVIDPEAYDNILWICAEGAQEETVTEGGPSVQRISRYGKASDIVSKMLSMPVFSEGNFRTAGMKGCETKLIGYYSPLSRCLQTSLAIATGQMLGASHRVFYLNFDAFPAGNLSAERGNLADLLYYHSCDPEALPLKIEQMKQRLGSLYYIPPAESFLQTEGVAGTEWLTLIRAIARTAQPEYLLLDLKTHVAGIMEILSLCDEIITITGADARDREKIASYRRVLALGDGEEILRRTRFCALPRGPLLPKHPAMLSDSPLAQIIRKEGLVPYGA